MDLASPAVSGTSVYANGLNCFISQKAQFQIPKSVYYYKVPVAYSFKNTVFWGEATKFC